MSWESIASKDLLSIPQSHNLSATHLLASPDGSRYLLDNCNDLCQFEENYSRIAGHGSSPDGDVGPRSLWVRPGLARSGQVNTIISCFWSCQRSLRQYIAKRKRAFRQYEQAMGTSATLGDRMAQMEAMDGAARCLETLRLQNKICNCRPLEFNTRLLEVASSIGAKLLVRKIRSRLALIYRALGDEDQCNTHLRLADQTDAALGLICGACGEVFGIQPASLEALPCAHILHARCAHEIFRRRDKSISARSCPACNKLLSSRLQLYGNEITAETENFDGDGARIATLNANGLNLDGFMSLNSETLLPLPTRASGNESAVFCNGLQNKSIPSIANTALLLTANASPNAVYRSNLSLASLNMRASSLTIDSGRNATSSV
ncbi:uncharacterized protein [Drosophila virilis]|uniref:uncharacterized protein isoform X3 n=1 Tax=Drosophila virilis TaxID=7244 RepID=UPI001395D02C|nr:uncharacterized protein LOC6636222 isoform X2 [Drosophila virilis]